MKVLVIGGGGREHAILWKLSLDSRRPELFCAPGNAGIAGLAACVPISAEDVSGLLAWARANKPDLTIVGPEAPLCTGLVDLFSDSGLRVFGPNREAARLEGSKRFAKEIMLAAGVPTARFQACSCVGEAMAALSHFALPVVIKADGLAAGKGVVIAATRDEAVAAIRSMLVDARFGAAGANVLIEEFLDGEEASILAWVDGEHVVMLPSSQDHKRVGDHDRGPNTGGMGAYSPAPVVAPELIPAIRDRILLPTLAELRRRGMVYQGVLYAGLIIGRAGPHVLEFNCRFGDPETEAVLPRLAGDIIPVFEACIDGALDASMVRIRPEACATVIMASGGYPGDYRKGLPIAGLEAAAEIPDTMVFHAGTAREGDRVVTSGGRVLAVTATGANLRAAVARAYEAVHRIDFQGAHYRTDIASRAIAPQSYPI